MRVRSLIIAAAAAVAMFTVQSTRASVIFDDFNTDEGHFNLAPNYSGSSSTIDPTSTADQVADPAQAFEGAGYEHQVLIPVTVGTAVRERFLSGGGAAANNISFTTSSGTDGWIGFYARTTEPGWTGQIWLEGASNNGSVEKPLTADGQWHLYEWNIDDTSGGADGWGSVAGIIGGDAAVANGSHTIDSVIFRNTSAPATSNLDMDFVAKSDSGSIAAMVPEPASLGLLGLAGLGLLRRRRQA